MIVVVVLGSLLNVSQPVQVKNIDKLHHLVAYGALMFWWGMVQPRGRWWWAAGLIGLGVALEYAQSLTPYRSLDYRDMAFNAGGVALAMAALFTPASALLAWVDRQIRNRLDARTP
jgi:VanZ family protein